MLDTDTKRRIDTARDILVGKVPDPKSQVEQITIALIYKFMDDMDADAEELGGKRKFFTGEFARYGWAKLMSAGIGGHELIGLYGEGISTMPQNPGIPALFRDIFKNAYLPYRAPETLKSFLKIIDEFSYDHSERLGDAFEYLLSVLGSQGDAGQFRTPRHIIDFMVEVLAPKKGEAILDPACGTAGFLISAWKHILRTNTDAKGHSTLTPDEKGRLATSFKGYDISPDMVRLSLVNLYLHGFTDPHIYEYDTLTSEDRWNEFADLILANPPFMSPKGGIKPHKRFSIQAKRSEVLFVDYMAEHLTPTGRAGIIVPEGIIFQSQTAYKELRKMLVENSLVAVISLPAGVFQPYSGVKTSILILDKSLAKQTDTIAFFKVENDGFGLGAQRRATDGEQLTQVAEAVKEFFGQVLFVQDLQDKQDKNQKSCKSCKSCLNDLIERGLALVVAKEKIAANGDYNLSGERYREAGAQNHAFPLVQISDVCTINPRKSQLSDLSPDTRVSFVPMADLAECCMAFQPREEKQLSEVTSTYTYFEDNDVLLAKVTPCFENGKAGIARGLINGIGFGSSEFYVLRSNGQVLPEWLYFCVTHQIFRVPAIAQMTGTGGLQRVPRGFVEGFQIPLPPLDVQKEIVAEIEGYHKVINGARAVLDNYRPHIPIHPDWPMVELGEVCIFKRGPFGGSLKKEIFVKNGYAVYEQGHAIANEFTDFRYFIDQEKFDEMRGFQVQPGELIMSCSGTMGKVAIIPDNAPTGIINQALLKLAPKDSISGVFLKHWMESTNFQKSLADFTYGAAIKNVASVEILKGLKLPLPPHATQQAIVAEIEAEQALVNANRELIERFEKKIQATLARVWGEEANTL